MNPYYGPHSIKQHIHGKPIRFGFKRWCLAICLGYLGQAIAYQGFSTGNTNFHLSVGGWVVKNLVAKFPKDFPVHVYLDIFLHLLDCTWTSQHRRYCSIKVLGQWDPHSVHQAATRKICLFNNQSGPDV